MDADKLLNDIIDMEIKCKMIESVISFSSKDRRYYEYLDYLFKNMEIPK